MTEEDVKYETRTIRSLRGMEARTRAKWENDGWEFVERVDAPMLRSKLTFRRVKRQMPRWIWVAGGAVAAAAVGVIVIGSLAEGDTAPAGSATSRAALVAATEAPVLPTSSPTPTPTSASASPTVAEASGSKVKRSEVVAVFKAYFSERAAANVMVAKAVTKVKFADGVVKVTFDPAAAGVSQEVFDSTKGFDNLAKFAATPVAFADETGDRLRPAIDRIKTVLPDGTSLGSFSRTDILALNELDGVTSGEQASPSEEAQPTITTRGVTETDAVIACARFGEIAFPYGFKDHSFLGVINQEIVRNRWFIKHEATITNAYDADRDAVFECTVGGTHANPRVKTFRVSN